MSGGDLQHAVAGAVVDGQFDFDTWNRDVPHDAGTGHVKSFAVELFLLGGHMPPVAVRGQLLVVFARLAEHRLLFGT